VLHVDKQPVEAAVLGDHAGIDSAHCTHAHTERELTGFKLLFGVVGENGHDYSDRISVAKGLSYRDAKNTDSSQSHIAATPMLALSIWQWW
jgi:hypothetical protein